MGNVVSGQDIGQNCKIRVSKRLSFHGKRESGTWCAPFSALTEIPQAPDEKTRGSLACCVSLKAGMLISVTAERHVGLVHEDPELHSEEWKITYA